MVENKAENNKESKVVRYLTGKDLLALPEIEWLWPGYIPIGHITLVVGQPGSGKSAFAQDLTHRLEQVRGWPCGSPNIIYSKTLWLDAEGAKTILAQRIRGWKMNPEGIIIPYQKDIYADFMIANPNSIEDVELILIAEQIRMVVIDSLSGIHRLDEKDSKDMKALLNTLHNLASNHQCAVVLIHHLNKGEANPIDGKITLDRVRGSTQIGASVRSVLAIDEGRFDSGIISKDKAKRIYQIKNNLGEQQEDPLHFEITGERVEYFGKLPAPLKKLCALSGKKPGVVIQLARCILLLRKSKHESAVKRGRR